MSETITNNTTTTTAPVEEQPKIEETTTNESSSVEETSVSNSRVGLGEIVHNENKKGGEFDDVIEKKVVAWIKEQVNKEKKRIISLGSKSISVDVKNAGIIKEDNKIINRMELNTSFDFNKITQIMVSDSVECPMKKGYYYINVLLFANNPIPLLVPYIYLKSNENKLTDWLFINNQFQRSQHKINEFKDV